MGHCQCIGSNIFMAFMAFKIARQSALICEFSIEKSYGQGLDRLT